MNADKEALKDLFKRDNKALSMSQVLAGLDNPVQERTVRRWLNALVEEGYLEKTGRYKSTKYQLKLIGSHKDAAALGQTDTTNSVIFSKEGQQLVSYVRKPLYLREPCTYNEAWINDYIPNKSYYLTPKQRNLLAQMGARLMPGAPAGTYAKKIFDRLLIDLSFNSSRLEGNTYSLLETEKLLFEDQPALGKLDIEMLMILNHKEAIRFLIDGINRIQASKQSVKTMHYLLSDGLVQPEDSGHVRRDSIQITGTAYVPIDGGERLDSLLSLISDKGQAINDPFEQSFFFLCHIAYLQAFIDVNKRTSRLVSNIPLVSQNLVPLSFNDVDKDDYNSSLIVIYEKQNVIPFAELYVWSYLRSCKQYDITAESMGFDAIRAQYRQQRRELIAYIIKEKIVNKEIIKVIKKKALEMIPKSDQSKFISDVEAEISSLEFFKISGMGISEKEFKTWIKAQKEK